MPVIGAWGQFFRNPGARARVCAVGGRILKPDKQAFRSACHFSFRPVHYVSLLDVCSWLSRSVSSIICSSSGSVRDGYASRAIFSSRVTYPYRCSVGCVGAAILSSNDKVWQLQSQEGKLFRRKLSFGSSNDAAARVTCNELRENRQAAS